MPSYKRYNWFNVTEFLDEVKRYGKGTAYFKEDTEIHKVDVSHNKETEFTITINDIEMGVDFNFSESYGLIRSCIADLPEAL